MKKLILFFIAGTVCISSCTETFAPNVDYGDQTYINDYSNLVDAVNNLNQSLDSRFNALNDLLSKGLADIKVSIDDNTGAIEVLTSTTKDGFEELNMTILNGFAALNIKIDENGTKIVTAMNENGEALRLLIDETGKLISADLAAIKEVVAKVGEELKVAIEGVEDMIGFGFATLNITINENGERIITAVNEHGELLKAEIDQTGKLIFGGLMSIKEVVAKVGEELKVAIEGVEDMIGFGFATLNITINENGEKIITAINEHGELLELAIDDAAETISTKISALTEQQHKDIMDALIADGVYDKDTYSITMTRALYEVITAEKANGRTYAYDIVMNMILETKPILTMKYVEVNNISCGYMTNSETTLTAELEATTGETLLPVVDVAYDKETNADVELVRLYRGCAAYKYNRPSGIRDSNNCPNDGMSKKLVIDDARTKRQDNDYTEYYSYSEINVWMYENEAIQQNIVVTYTATAMNRNGQTSLQE